jgi:cellulose biosynthesis protein BcsQ
MAATGEEEGTAEILGYGSAAEIGALAERLPKFSEAFGCHILAANFDRLSHQEIALTSQPILLARFVEMIELLDGAFDYVLFDCPPALRTLTTATMYAADFILLVVEPSKESIDGLSKLLSYLTGLRRLIGHDPVIAGAVVTKADPRERLVQAVEGALLESGHVPWVQQIYSSVAFKDAYAANRPLSATSRTPSQIRALADITSLANRILTLGAVPA